MTEVIARVHSVHLVNVEQRQAAADPQTKRPISVLVTSAFCLFLLYYYYVHDLCCESACFRQLSSTTTIAIYYASPLIGGGIKR